jgi:hypothetical protein
MIALVLVAASIPRRAQGQGPPATAHWDVAAAVGAGFRSERGHTIGGGRFEAAARHGWGSSGETWFEFGGAVAQITAHEGADGNGANVKENSVELLARVDRRLLHRAAWSVDGSLGPVISIAAGCQGGGTFAADTAGGRGIRCTNDFANKGRVRPGAAARITSEIRGANAAFTAGVELAMGTVAAGDGIGAAAMIGFRARLR